MNTTPVQFSPASPEIASREHEFMAIVAEANIVDSIFIETPVVTNSAWGVPTTSESTVFTVRVRLFANNEEEGAIQEAINCVQTSLRCMGIDDRVYWWTSSK